MHVVRNAVKSDFVERSIPEGSPTAGAGAAAVGGAQELAVGLKLNAGAFARKPKAA